MTYYTVFMIELHSRRVRVGGATPYPDEAFMTRVIRELTDAVDGLIGPGRILIVTAIRSGAGRSRPL